MLRLSCKYLLPKENEEFEEDDMIPWGFLRNITIYLINILLGST